MPIRHYNNANGIIRDEAQLAVRFYRSRTYSRAPCNASGGKGQIRFLGEPPYPSARRLQLRRPGIMEVENIVDLECPVCFEEENDLYLLNCQHSFCHTCLVDLQQDKTIFKCPKCQAPQTTPTGGFPRNRDLNNIRNAVHGKKKEQLRAELAKREKLLDSQLAEKEKQRIKLSEEVKCLEKQIADLSLKAVECKSKLKQIDQPGWTKLITEISSGFNLVHMEESTTAILEGPKKTHTNLYITGVGSTVEEEHLKTEFSKYGTPTSIKVMRNQKNPHWTGIAFVNMSSQTEAENAITFLDKTLFMGDKLTVQFHKTKAELQAGKVN